MSAPFDRHERDGYDPLLTPFPTPVVSAAQLAHARVVRALRDLDRGRRRYAAAYARLLRRERDREARKTAHRTLLAELRRLEAAFEAAMEAAFEAEAREAQESVAVRARWEGWP